MKLPHVFGLRMLRSTEYVKLVERLRWLESDRAATLEFLNAIERGSLAIEANVSDRSEVIHKLSAFQESMMGLVRSAEQTRWHDAGMAIFNDILTRHFNDQRELFDRILSQLAKYVHANQAALFLLTDSQADARITLQGCYAYDRKKYIEKEFAMGESLVGQCMLERNSIMLTNIPQYYTKITSGLGEATPGCLLIVPLMDERGCIGAIELASFKKFSTADVRFIESLSKNIAASISNIRQNTELRILFARSEQAQADVREKEEQIRQQIEALQTANETMIRKSNELESMRDELQQKNIEIENMRAQEKDLLESKLEAQKRSYEMIIDRMREKLSQQNLQTN